MKKVLPLLFLTFSAFSQVFRMDTTFHFEPVRKQYNDYPIINALPNGLLNITFSGNIYHDKPVSNGNLIVDKDGKLLQTINLDNYLKFSHKASNHLMTADGKYILLVQIHSDYTLQRNNQDGTVDTTFIFPRYKEFINQIFLLSNNYILVALPNYAHTTLNYQIFDNEGKFVRTFQLSDYGFKENARLNSLVFNEAGEHFLYAYEDKTGKVIKTNKDLVRDESFPELSNLPDAYMAAKGSIALNKNMLYVYSSDSNESKNKIEKYDGSGKKIWQADFSKPNITYNGIPTFYYQQDESIDLIFTQGTHIKIKADGTLDSVFYQNKKQDNISFLHAFADGSYWVMQNNNGVIEKMYADGSIDPTFKISVKFERPLYPNRIEKQGNNYLVELIVPVPSFNSPYQVRLPVATNCIRVYNQKHQLLHDFFDSKTMWQTYKTKDALIVRGDGKFYVFDAQSKIQISADTLQVNDVIDWDNKWIYRQPNDYTLERYHMGAGRDKSFSISSYNGLRIFAYDLLPNNQIAVQVTDNISFKFFLYHNKGLQDKQFSILETNLEISPNGYFNTWYVNDSYLIRKWRYEGQAILNQSFAKVTKDHDADTTYEINRLNGGQFWRYDNTGAIYINTANLIFSNQKSQHYNFARILPNGKIDPNFSLMDIQNVYGFEFFDQNTLYAIGDRSLYKFTKSPEQQYFNYTQLANKIVWDKAQAQKLNYRTNISPIRIEVTGNARLEGDSLITFMPKSGLANITFRDVNGKILAHQEIELTKITPTFVYTYPKITSGTSPYTFSVSSSAKLPVKIISNGIESTGTAQIDTKTSPSVKITLRSEGNDQYEAIEETFYLIIQSPLSQEPGLTDGDIICYPNPTTDELYIKADILPIDSFQLVGVNGKQIPIVSELIGDKHRLNLNNIPQGVYILVMKTGQRQIKRKVVID